MEPLTEHATEVFAILCFIVVLLVGILGTMLKLWFVDFVRWKGEIKTSLDGLRTELHRDIVRLWRHIGVIEGTLKIQQSPEELNGDKDE